MTPITCPSCGKEIGDIQAPTPAVSSSKSVQPSGRAVFLGAMAEACHPKFCPHCGAPITSTRPRGSAFVIDDRAPAIDPRKAVVFQHLKTSQQIDITQAWAWTLLFGFLYFAVRGIWRHAVIGLALAIVTAGISWLFYPFFAKQIVRNHLLVNDWQPVR